MRLGLSFHARRLWPARESVDDPGGACQLLAILLWMHNGLGYIYSSVGFNGLTAARRAVPQKDANMSIEQFIENEVKSNDVVLFMKGTPQFPQCGFSGQVVQILDHVGVRSDANMSIEQFIENEVKSNDVVLFMKGTPQFPQCGFSGQVVQILDHVGVGYKGLNVLESADLRNGIKTYSNWPTIPQLYVKGEFVGGCDIVREMFQDGGLKSLFKDKGLPVKEGASA